MSLIAEKPTVTSQQLLELDIELITLAASGALTEERYDQIVDVFMVADAAPETVANIIFQGDQNWRKKYARYFSGNIF